MLFIEPNSTDPAFLFAAEEFCMQHFRTDEPIRMLWHTHPCVMLGRNQVADAEINLQAAERLGVQVVRRGSGGGTIFTDPNTLQYTLILPYDGNGDVKQMERIYVASPMVDALCQMGIPAKQEGRNDIFVDGKKVSGLAQFVKNDRLCSHGSLLYDTDFTTLSQVLRTDEEKIRTKALRSMRSGITTLKGYLNQSQSIFDFWKDLKGILCDNQSVREYIFSGSDIVRIEEIRAAKYANPDWIFGETPQFSYHNQKRFPGGKVAVFLDVKKGMINACKIQGDFLSVSPVRELEQQLEARPYQYRTVAQILSQIRLQPYIGGITQEQLLACFFTLS